jgi:hypothetical protein
MNTDHHTLGPVPIVERLRYLLRFSNFSADDHATFAEAADTITDLLGALEQIARGTEDAAPPFRSIGHAEMQRIARAAITRATSPHDTSSQGEGK